MSLWVRWPDVGIRTLCTVVGLQVKWVSFLPSLFYSGILEETSPPSMYVGLTGFSKSIFNTLSRYLPGLSLSASLNKRDWAKNKRIVLNVFYVVAFDPIKI